MRSHRFLSSALMSTCFALLLAASPAKAQCGPNTVGFRNVGIVANNPFHAEVTRTTTGHTDMAATLRQNYPQWVARDTQGRIRTETVVGEFKHDNGPDAGSNVEARVILICDPVAQTITHIDTATATAKIVHSRYGAPSARSLKSVTPRSFCSSRMPSSHLASRFEVEDLGDQTIEGVEAHGERIKLPMIGAAAGEESPNGGSTSERWCSDSLSALVLTITGNTRTGVKSTIAMQKIERTEPDPVLFQIPPDYTVTESVAEPAKSAASP
jgi:hypothetical protein